MVKEQPSIAAITAEEVDTVVPLFESQHREHGIEQSRERLTAVLQRCLAEPEYGFVLVAGVETAPVGVAYVAGILSLEHGGRSAWLEEFYVSPQWRGHGIGSLLLKAVAAETEARGWRALDLEVDQGHQRTIALYTRNGFAPVLRSRFVLRFPEMRQPHGSRQP